MEARTLSEPRHPWSLQIFPGPCGFHIDAAGFSPWGDASGAAMQDLHPITEAVTPPECLALGISGGHSDLDPRDAACLHPPTGRREQSAAQTRSASIRSNHEVRHFGSLDFQMNRRRPIDSNHAQPRQTPRVGEFFRRGLIPDEARRVPISQLSGQQGTHLVLGTRAKREAGIKGFVVMGQQHPQRGELLEVTGPSRANPPWNGRAVGTPGGLGTHGASGDSPGIGMPASRCKSRWVFLLDSAWRGPARIIRKVPRRVPSRTKLPRRRLPLGITSVVV